MSVDAVLDTNVLLYAASKDPADHAKAEIALHLVAILNSESPSKFCRNSSTTTALGSYLERRRRRSGPLDKGDLGPLQPAAGMERLFASCVVERDARRRIARPAVDGSSYFFNIDNPKFLHGMIRPESDDKVSDQDELNRPPTLIRLRIVANLVRIVCDLLKEKNSRR